MPGTYRKRGKDSYLLEVCIGTDYAGKPIRYNKTVHCKSPKEADKALAKFYTECENGTISKPTNLTLTAFCEQYAQEVAPIRMKKGSLTECKRIIKKEIAPTIGKHKLNKLTVLNIQKWINALSKRVSPKTVKNYFSTLHSILDCAVKWQLISSNPCHYVDLPKIKQKETDWLRKDELENLIELLTVNLNQDLMYKAAILLVIFTGLRKGELAGLKWEDFDWDKSTIKIKRTRLYKAELGVYEDTPKSDKGSRTETVPKEILDLFKRLLNEQRKQKIKLGTKWEDSDYVLINEFGAPIYPNNIYKFFKTFQLRNNLRYVSLHKLRHTHASMLAYLKIDHAQISKRLGHSQTSTTENIYIHLFEEVDSEISDKLSNTFLKNLG